MRKSLVLLISGSLLWAFAAFASPYSDLAREEFDKGPSALSPLPRSPFQPGMKGVGKVDLAALVVEGIVWGDDVKMALLSGRVVREGEKLGRYHVKKVVGDSVVLSYGDTAYPLRLQNYVTPEKRNSKRYHVEFQNCSLRGALQLLSRAANLNLISPEGLVGQVSVSLRNIELIQAIRSILRVNGYEYAVESGIIRVGRPDDFTGGTDLMTASFRLKYATSKDLMDTIKPLLSERGQVIADERTNTLMVKDRDAIVATIRDLLNTIDRKDRQVRIEARIVDATKDFSRSLGIRWGLSGTKGQVTLSGTQDVGLNADTSNPLNVNLGADNPTSGIGLILGRVAGLSVESQLSAAEQNGQVKILSQPTVTTLNNMAAKIRSGTKIYVKSTSSINVGTSGGDASGESASLQEIDTGIELTVTPQISVDNFIKMKIDASQSEADFSRTVDGIPAVIDSTASTTVILQDGSTTVIGGLYRMRTSNQKRGVPGLQRIPVMGYLFKQKTKTKTNTELMIFITPKIVGS
jgi:type IV pilus assembly protein PilQ